MKNEKSDVEIIIPGRELTLSTGEVVRIRELAFGETLMLRGRPGAAEFFAELEGLGGVGPGEVPDSWLVIDAAMRHPAWWLAFLAAASGLTEDRIRGLSDVDGTRLAVEAAAENGGFFGVTALARAKAARARGSSTSTRSSSATGTPAPQS